MIKVLLVDDEKLALEYLEEIIDWEYYGFDVVGAALDSGKALELYKKYKPELVISDIKMPGMNGLELVNAIREYGKESHILFLSAYKNFYYVKQAIRLDIDDYILKSDLEEESFLKKILKLKEKIDKENAQRKYTISRILEEIFKKRDIREEDYRKILDEDDYIRIQKKYYYIILSRRTQPQFLEKYRILDRRKDQSCELEFQNICQSEAEKQEMRVVSVFNVNEREYFAVLEGYPESAAEWENVEKLKGFAEEVYKRMEEETESCFDVYYGRKRTIRQFANFYRENKSRISGGYLRKKTRVSEWKEAAPVPEETGEVLSITGEELYSMMKNKDQEGIEQCLKVMETAMEKEDSFSFFWYVKNFLEAFCYAEGALTDKKSGRKFSISENSASYDFSDAQELIRFLRDKTEEIRLISEGNQKASYSQIIAQAVRYIQNNFADTELTSAAVAGAVNISASWLSTKFKGEVGVSVNDYINQIRIDRAKKMFQENDYMVYEVSEKTGFTSSQYFSRIFKEYVGVTPNQYRRKKDK